jgi:hypothetical protein
MCIEIQVLQHFQRFISSITDQISQKNQENLLHPGLHGGLFGMSVIVHFRRHVDFAFLFVRRARAAACVGAWPWNVDGLALNEMAVVE